MAEHPENNTFERNFLECLRNYHALADKLMWIGLSGNRAYQDL